MGAGVHAQRAADGAGYAAQEGETVDARFRRRAGDLRIQRRRAGDDALVRGGCDSAERASPQADDDSADSAVADDEIRAEADHGDRDFVRQVLQEVAQIVLVGRREQDLRRAADAKPGEGRQFDMVGQLAAQRGHERLQVGQEVRHQSRSNSC